MSQMERERMMQHGPHGMDPNDPMVSFCIPSFCRDSITVNKKILNIFNKNNFS